MPKEDLTLEYYARLAYQPLLENYVISIDLFSRRYAETATMGRHAIGVSQVSIFNVKVLF